MEKIAIKEVKIGVRYRKDFGDMKSLQDSMTRVGQLQPIVLDENNELVIGERRLRAAMNMGWDEIGYIRWDQLDELEKKDREIEENIQRKEFNWPEEVLAIEDLYNRRQKKYGPAMQGSKEGGYGLKQGSEELERSMSALSFDLACAKAIHEFPKLAEEKSKSAAFKRYHRERELKLRGMLADQDRTAAREEREQTEPQEHATDAERPVEREHRPALFKSKTGFKGYGLVYNGDSVYVLQNLPDAIVDCVVMDPPYALGLGSEDGSTSGRRLSEHHGGLYDDDPHRVMDMLDKVFMHLARVTKPRAHIYTFFHHNQYEDTRNLLERHFGPSSVEAVPLIWIKNTSGIGDPNIRWCPAYESFFMVNRGRPLVKPQGFNYVKYDTVPKGQKNHPTEKPTALLRHIIEASCIKGELVMDPFAGSGSTLVAAVEMGCRFYGVELDEVYYRRIVDRLSLSIGAIQEEEDAQGKAVDNARDVGGSVAPPDEPASGSGDRGDPQES